MENKNPVFSILSESTLGVSPGKCGKQEVSLFKPLPVLRESNQKMINENYYRIKNEVANIVESEIDILMNTPGKEF